MEATIFEPETKNATDRLLNVAWFLGWAIASSLACLGSARQLGATYDEPIYLEQGLKHWHTGSYSGLLQLGTMPLPVDVTTLPVYLWERGHGIRFDAKNDLYRVLPWARAGTLLFWWILLWYGWKAGGLLAGPWGARLSVAFLAAEPSLLAHAGLATTDIAVSACVLACLYHFYTGRQERWLRRVGVPGIFFGAAILAKVSGLVFCSISLLTIECICLSRTGAFSGCDWKHPWQSLRYVWRGTHSLRVELLQIVGIGLAVTFIYCGSDWKSESSFVAWANGLSDGHAKNATVWMADHCRIFSNAGDGIIRQFKHNLRGHGAYLLGHWDSRYLWYYFPVLLSVKLCLSLLVAPVALALLQPRALANSFCLVAGVLVLFTLTCHVQIGIRLIFPVLVIGVVGIAAALAQAGWISPPLWKTHLLKGVAICGLVWATGSTIAVWPNGLCYVNELWGGTCLGYQQVSDGNYDWGQGLPELARWQREVGSGDLAVWYFGMDSTIERLPVHVVPIHTMPIQTFEDIRRAVPTRYLAASTTRLYGAVQTVNLQRAAEILRERRPVARTSTFLIYDLRDSVADQVSLSSDRSGRR